ncbi:MAG: 6-carboxytetrahydropterin synthase QueD [Marinilabiliales bacterium]|nr:MAG: 6-carboxytetrahydropterin synthase QueD [Marinilabiliales bacterium]
MAIIRVTKEFHFESSHALWNYNGKCKNLHGHSYKLFVTVKGKTIEDNKNPKDGMVIDFGELKQIVNKKIVDIYDHAVIINKSAAGDHIDEIPQMFQRIIKTDYQPTCENMVAHFANIIIAELPENVKLYSVRLFETASSYAEWYAEEN